MKNGNEYRSDVVDLLIMLPHQRYEQWRSYLNKSKKSEIFLKSKLYLLHFYISMVILFFPMLWDFV